MSRNSFLIFIPTYNELENVETLYNQIKDLNLDVDILFFGRQFTGWNRAID